MQEYFIFNDSQKVVKYFSCKSNCLCMLASWWYKQVLINLVAHGSIFLCSFLNLPYFQYIRNKRLINFLGDFYLECVNFTSLTINDEKSDFWPWKSGVDLYMSSTYTRVNMVLGILHFQCWWLNACIPLMK